MKKINTNLAFYIKNMKGNLLGIGLQDSKLINLIDQNSEIQICDLLNNNSFDDSSKEGIKQKKIWIYKLRKVFKKKRFHYIIGDIKILKKHLKTFVKDSIYINHKTIYLYADLEYDYSRLEKMYHRYQAIFEVEPCKDGNIFIIDIQHAKDHPFKNKWYIIWDSFLDLFDMVGDFLSN